MHCFLHLAVVSLSVSALERAFCITTSTSSSQTGHGDLCLKEGAATAVLPRDARALSLAALCFLVPAVPVCRRVCSSWRRPSESFWLCSHFLYEQCRGGRHYQRCHVSRPSQFRRPGGICHTARRHNDGATLCLAQEKRKEAAVIISGDVEVMLPFSCIFHEMTLQAFLGLFEKMGWSCRSVCLSSLFSQEALGLACGEELAAAKHSHSRLDKRRQRGSPISWQELVLVDLAASKIPGGTSLFRQRVHDLAAFPLRDTEAWHFQELAASCGACVVRWVGRVGLFLKPFWFN